MNLCIDCKFYDSIFMRCARRGNVTCPVTGNEYTMWLQAREERTDKSSYVSYLGEHISEPCGTGGKYFVKREIPLPPPTYWQHFKEIFLTLKIAKVVK